MKLTAKDIENIIVRGLYGLNDIMWLSQCRVGCGFGVDGDRTMDLWGIATKRPYEHVAVEIKVSRGDFLRDIKRPLKQRRARLFANKFYFATPRGLLTANDMPPYAGLIEIGQFGESGPVTAMITVPAPQFDSAPPTWSFVASLVRRFKREGVA